MPTTPPIAVISGERLEGVAHRGAAAWRGIRYATAPRFGMPVVAGDADVEARRYDAFGPAAPQPGSLTAPARTLGATASDDCLVLNVYAPMRASAAPAASTATAKAVVVWIHGGAFASGSGAMYDGADLARDGDVVVVTINYRLGVLGFGDLSHLGVPRNLGLHDQIAALRWVRANIAAFGGDPDRVTVAGESAGSLSISLLMVAPAAAGLFHGAVLQSGALSLVHDVATGARLGARYRELLGAHAASIDALRAAPLGAFLAAQTTVDAEFDGTVPAGPIYDGDLLPASLEDARARPAPQVPVLAGSMRDEIRLFDIPPLRKTLPRTRAMVLDRTARRLGADARAAIEAAYPATELGRRALATDADFAMPTRHFAERHAARGGRAWVYRFDKGGPLLGAAHALDLFYLWPMPGPLVLLLRGGPLVGARKRLAERFRRAWLAFVRDGTPGAGWPEYGPAEFATYVFDGTDRVERDPDRTRRLAWAGLDAALAQID